MSFVIANESAAYIIVTVLKKGDEPMITISLCMIVRDESAVLARCLDSVHDLVDEIIIVDTGSLDNTKDIARQYTNQVYDFLWVDDFAAARNAAFEKATMEYCMWLDADDVLIEENRKKFQQMKECLDNTVDAVMLPYQSGEAFFCYRERIVRNAADFRWKGRVHETITLTGNIVYDEAAVSHCSVNKSQSDRNLRIYRAMQQNGEVFSPRDKYYYGRELYDHQQYKEAAQVFQQFLQNPDGWYVNKIDACRLLAVCYGHLKEHDKILPALLRALAYDVPNAGICCDIGAYFLQRQQYAQAIWWYKRALESKPDGRNGGFVSKQEYGYIPALQLCVCYDKLGQKELAQQYNELAAQCEPESEAVKYNREYFRAYMQKK